MDKQKWIDISPELIRLAIKIIKFSKGGFDKEEKTELAGDLMSIAVKILESVDEK